MAEVAAQRDAPAGDFDAIVIGSGFAGAVTACRLVEAGFRICILERGRRYGPQDFPRYPMDELFANEAQETQQFAPPPDLSRWLWDQDRGLYDVRDLGGTLAVQAAGYGGGSLIYANVHVRPPNGLFDSGWPAPYGAKMLTPYYDLAAYMLGAMPVPQQLAKTLQLKRVAGPGSWFRMPLAVSFDGRNVHGREQKPCDMRGRCWRGCDQQAKNTLDLNYLARAEDGDCDIRTMAEVTTIEHRDGLFTVSYIDLLQREKLEPTEARISDRPPFVRAKNVFLCAGAVNTTELLFKNQEWLPSGAALGAHYFPNSASLAMVFDCDEAHEPDYGPTITSALLYDQKATGAFARSIDFDGGKTLVHRSEPAPCSVPTPWAGAIVTSSSGGHAQLAHDPILDWGNWNTGAAGAAALIVIEGKESFRPDDKLTFTYGDHTATAVARSSLVEHWHWFLVEDGGYPPDLDPLVGIFRSPLWLQRNRYLESPPQRAAFEQRPVAPPRRQTTPLRRPPTGRLRLEVLVDALSATPAKTRGSEGVRQRTFSAARSDFTGTARERELLLPGLLDEPIGAVFPDWFVQTLADNREVLVEQAAAFALPMLGRLLDELSATAVSQIDPETRSRLSGQSIDDRQMQVLARGLIRQVVQILAGSEAAVAAKAVQVLLNPVPGTPGQLVTLLGSVLLWAIGYDTNTGYTGVLLTQGRDVYRGRLTYDPTDDKLHATLPSQVLDTAGGTQEHVLREIASQWRGELRTNPGWTTLGKRVTVHSQGGCPMGAKGRSVTNADGEVFGCEGLYVMDAAAFPTSVGVNPSATIAAIAEYKIERFIQRHHPTWRAAQHPNAQEWVNQHGRAALDPLNQPGLQSRPAPKQGVIGLTFTEEMRGSYSVFSSESKREFNPDELHGFPTGITAFLEAEDDGVPQGQQIHLKLDVMVSDLARLVSSDRQVQPVEVPIRGTAVFEIPIAAAREAAEPVSRTVADIAEGSYVQLFVRARGAESRKFFRYHLRYHVKGQLCVLSGVKVLRDAPGFDAWHDSSTVYFEASEPNRLLRGILRVPIETFIRQQLRGMKISGTSDPARQSWALLAFYKYFARELADIYLKRADAGKDALIELLTAIHV